MTLAIAIFLVFLALTIGIAVVANRRAGTAAGFFAAHGTFGPVRNALALAGDFISAAAFLGVAGLIATAGYDGVFYSVGAFAGWPLLMVLLAGRLRQLGRYTFADALCVTLHEPTVRIVSAASTLVIVMLYLVGQMVGAGALIGLLFGLPYATALVLIGALMALYVVLGGMAATTWVQIIKAVLLIGGTFYMVATALATFGSPEAIFAAAAATAGDRILQPGPQLRDPVSALSLGLALVCGTCGLPHVLMRFFTVPDARAARQSVALATAIIGVFSVGIILLGYAAVSLVPLRPGAPGGGNMIMLQLARHLGGEAFFGFIAAVTFATILAVVSGLALAGASAIGHDLYARLICGGQVPPGRDVLVSRLAVIGLAAAAVALGLVFEGQNIAVLVSLAIAIAAGVNFPLLMLGLYWPGLTSRGLAWGGGIGLGLSLVLIILGPAVWSRALGLGPAPFAYDYPTLFVLPAVVLAAVAASLLQVARPQRG
jgi:cation/acetate symporter